MANRHLLHRGKSGSCSLLAVVLAIVGAVMFVFVQGCAPKEAQKGGSEAMSTEAVSTSQSVEEQPVELSDFENKIVNGEYSSIRLIGDSVTAGYGTDDYEDPNITGKGKIIYDDGAGETWRETPATVQCWANAFRSWANERDVSNFVNAGISGWFMKDLAKNPDAWIMEGADVMVVALGANDAGYYGTSEYEKDARTALSAVASKCKLLIVVAPAADLRDPKMLVEPASELGDVLSRICNEEGYVFVDPREAVTTDMFCEDGLHPNTEGSMAIWECIRATLEI